MQALTEFIVPAHVLPENIDAFRALMRDWQNTGLPNETPAGIGSFLLALLNSGGEGVEAATEFAFIPGAIHSVREGEHWPWEFVKNFDSKTLGELLAKPGLMELVANWLTADEIWNVISAWPDHLLRTVLAAPGAFYALASNANGGHAICLKVDALGGTRTGWPSGEVEESWVTFQSG